MVLKQSIQLKHHLLKKKYELANEKNRLAASEKLIIKLTKKADDLAVKALKKNQLTHLSESNAKRKRVDGLKTGFAFQTKMQKLEEEQNTTK